MAARWLTTRKAVGGGVLAVALYGGYRVVASDSQFDPYNLGVARFGRAAWPVGSIGLDYKRSIFAGHVSPGDADYDAEMSRCHQRSADKLLKLCTDNGGCFVKVGQHIGALDYLLPKEYVQTMKVLHHNAPEMKLDDVYQVIREDLGKEPKELFSEFDERPLGTASLAQVHKAKLKSDGRTVAVKVQHRYVRNHSLVDIYTMDFLVRTVKFFFPQFEFMWLANEMKKNLPLELSFTQEGLNAEKVSILLERFSWLKIPEIFWDLTTERVLTMEFCKGGHINDLEHIKRKKIDPFWVSNKISKMYSEMIYRFGYVHCDPHFGNVLVDRDEDGQPIIILLDHGLYTQLTHEFRHDYAQFMLSVYRGQVDEIKRLGHKLGVGESAGLLACMIAARSWNSIIKGVGKTEKNAAESQEIKENVQKYAMEIADVLADVNKQMILIFKTNDLLRAIEHALGTSNSLIHLIEMTRACNKCIIR